MEATYRREMKHNYLIIEPEDPGYDSYEAHMLEENGIEGLLKFHIKQVDNRKSYYYEITSKQPLSRILEYHSMGGEELKKLIDGIAQTLGRLETYLLQERQILLEPEYIYVEPERFSVFLCLVPGRQGRFTEEMTGLFRYLLGRVNHQDKECVVMAYGLYQESLKENYGMDDLLEILGKASRGKETEAENEELGYKEKIRDKGIRDKGIDKEIPDKEIKDKEIKNKEMRDKAVESKGEWSGEAGSRRAGDQAVRNTDFLPSEEPPLFSSSHRFREETGGTNSYDEESGKTPGLISRFARGAAASVLAMTGTGGVLWLVFGAAGIGTFWYAVAIMGVLAVPAAFWGAGKKDSLRSENIHKKEEPWSRQKEIHDWQMIFDEGTEEKEAKETKQEEEIFQTVLLTEPAPEKDIRYLRAAEPGSEDIAIAYVPYLIGKQEGLVDWVLDSDTISRIHVRIDREEDEYRISDLNSTNGTSINGRLLETNETAVLKRGDRVLIADFAFVFS